LSGSIEFLYQYFALGHGERVSAFILGDGAHPFWPQAEAVLMMFLVGSVLFLAIRYGRRNPPLALAGRMVLAYVLAAVLLFLLPEATNIHHWIQGTPFQYAGISLALMSLGDRPKTRAVLLIAVASLVLVRLPNVISAESALIQGRFSGAFDPTYTRLGEIAAEKSKDAAFIAANWGTATQLYCLGNGADDLVYQPFWSSNPAESTRLTLSQMRKTVVYIIVSGKVAVPDEAAASVMKAVETSSDWKEEPAETDLANLPQMHIRKFVRR
jgi:hypothetical protein